MQSICDELDTIDPTPTDYSTAPRRCYTSGCNAVAASCLYVLLAALLAFCAAASVLAAAMR